jgi:hypothetical protein
MGLFTNDDMPHTHEIVIDEKQAIITFFLRPDLEEFVSLLLGGTNKRKEWNEKEYGLTKFIAPNSLAWGYGEVLKVSQEQLPNAWIKLDCQLPFDARGLALYDIVGTIDDLATAISLFKPPEVDVSVAQLMMIDCLIVKGRGSYDGGSFDFKYSR